MLVVSFLVASMLIGNGSPAADTPCDQVVKDCQELVRASDEVNRKLEDVIEKKDSEIQHLQDNDKIIYKQPAPWLILGGIVSIFNPLVGVPLIAAGLARSL